MTGSARQGEQSCGAFYAQDSAHGVTRPTKVDPEDPASTSGQSCFRQVEVALNSAQRVIVNHSLVSQADNGFAFDAQCLVLQTLILWCGDFAPAIVGIFSAKLQLLYALVVFGKQPNFPVPRQKKPMTGRRKNIEGPRGWW